MEWVILCAGIFGAIIGSFLTVVVTRYDTDEKSIVTGRSGCPQCGAMIHWYDNIPLISYFLLLRGKCRGCKRPIGFLYPAMELLTAVTFAATVAAFGEMAILHVWDIVFLWVIFAALVVVFFYDFRTMYIPMNVIWVVYGLIVLYFALRIFGVIPGAEVDVLSVLLGAATGFVPLFLMSYLSREKLMGGGDAYIGAIGGALVGFPAVIFFLTVSFGLGAIIGIGLLITKVKTRKDPVPFGPFLVLGVIVTVLLPLYVPTIGRWLPYFSNPVF